MIGRLLSIFGGGTTFEDREGTLAHSKNRHTHKLAMVNATIASASRAFRKGVGSQRYNFQSRTDNAEFNKELEGIVKGWSKPKNFEIRGIHHRGSFERALIDQFEVKSGGFLIRHHFDKKFKYGYKPELIPLYNIDTGKNISSEWVNGFKVNKSGAITHVAIFTDSTNAISKDISTKELSIAINQWADPIQYSGISPMSIIKESLEYIDNHLAKELKGASNRAESPFFIKTKFFQTIMESIQKSILKEKIDSNCDSPDILNAKDIKKLQAYHDMTRIDKKDKIDDFVYIAADEEVIETGRGVFSIFSELYSSLSRNISSAVGHTASSIFGTEERSYNSALKGTQGEEETYKSSFEDVVALAWDDIYDNLIVGAKIKGYFSNIDDFWNNLEYYQDYELIRREKGHLDPVKTAKTRTEDLNNGTTNVPRELRKKGIDPETHILEQIEYIKKMEELFKEAKLEMPKKIESTLKDIDLINEDD